MPHTLPNSNPQVASRKTRDVLRAACASPHVIFRRRRQLTAQNRELLHEKCGTPRRRSISIPDNPRANHAPSTTPLSQNSTPRSTPRRPSWYIGHTRRPAATAGLLLSRGRISGPAPSKGGIGEGCPTVARTAVSRSEFASVDPPLAPPSKGGGIQTKPRRHVR